MNWDYCVRYEDDEGINRTDWDSEEAARKVFDKMKNEKVLKTRWADLIYAPLDEEDNPEAEEYVIDSFERKIINVFGQEVLVP